MKKKGNIVRYTASEARKLPDRTDWKRLKAMKDEDIDTSDIPALDSGFWDVLSAKLVTPNRERVSLRLKPEALSWFKQHGKGHITLMQAVLEAFAESRQPKH